MKIIIVILLSLQLTIYSNELENPIILLETMKELVPFETGKLYFTLSEQSCTKCLASYINGITNEVEKKGIKSEINYLVVSKYNGEKIRNFFKCKVNLIVDTNLSTLRNPYLLVNNGIDTLITQFDVIEKINYSNKIIDFFEIKHKLKEVEFKTDGRFTSIIGITGKKEIYNFYDIFSNKVFEINFKTLQINEIKTSLAKLTNKYKINSELPFVWPDGKTDSIDHYEKGLIEKPKTYNILNIYKNNNELYAFINVFVGFSRIFKPETNHPYNNIEKNRYFIYNLTEDQIVKEIEFDDEFSNYQYYHVEQHMSELSIMAKDVRKREGFYLSKIDKNENVIIIPFKGNVTQSYHYLNDKISIIDAKESKLLFIDTLVNTLMIPEIGKSDYIFFNSSNNSTYFGAYKKNDNNAIITVYKIENNMVKEIKKLLVQDIHGIADMFMIHFSSDEEFIYFQTQDFKLLKLNL